MKTGDKIKITSNLRDIERLATKSHDRCYEMFYKTVYMLYDKSSKELIKVCGGTNLGNQSFGGMIPYDADIDVQIPALNAGQHIKYLQSVLSHLFVHTEIYNERKPKDNYNLNRFDYFIKEMEKKSRDGMKTADRCCNQEFGFIHMKFNDETNKTEYTIPKVKNSSDGDWRFVGEDYFEKQVEL
jgi:hypothetical protein